PSRASALPGAGPLRPARASVRVGELAGYPAVEGRILGLPLPLQRHRGDLQRVEQVAKVQLRQRGHAVVGAVATLGGHPPSTTPTALTCTTTAVMLSSPPRPLASVMRASTRRAGALRASRICWRR